MQSSIRLQAGPRPLWSGFYGVLPALALLLGFIALGVPRTQHDVHTSIWIASGHLASLGGAVSPPLPPHDMGRAISVPARGSTAPAAIGMHGSPGRRQPSTRHAHPWIALTFDDGPWPYYTDAVLAVLHRYHVHATFFVVGRQVATYPDLVSAEAHAGNEVENHTWDHADLRWLSTAAMTQEITTTASLVLDLTGFAPLYLRPPYGDVNARVRLVAATQGERTVLWNVDPRDWARPGAWYITQTVLAYARDGAIVEMHDGGGLRDETVSALSTIVPTLQARGYRFVTMAQLLGGVRPRETAMAPRSRPHGIGGPPRCRFSIPGMRICVSGPARQP